VKHSQSSNNFFGWLRFACSYPRWLSILSLWKTTYTHSVLFIVLLSHLLTSGTIPTVPIQVQFPQQQFVLRLVWGWGFPLHYILGIARIHAGNPHLQIYLIQLIWSADNPSDLSLFVYCKRNSIDRCILMYLARHSWTIIRVWFIHVYNIIAFNFI